MPCLQAHDPNKPTTNAGLAVVLFRLHQYQGAQDLYARAYDILSSKLGPEDKEVATTMNNTAGLLKAMGKLADAEVVYRTVSSWTHCECCQLGSINPAKAALSVSSISASQLANAVYRTVRSAMAHCSLESSIVSCVELDISVC